MKRASILLISALMAASTTLSAQVDKKAKDLLDKVSAKTKSYTAYKVNFSFNLSNSDQKINETSQGVLSVKGDKYHLKMSDQEIFCDGKKVYTYQKETNEALVQNMSDMDDESITPQSIFMMYEKGFKLRYVKDINEGGKKIAVIDLYPMDPKKKDYTMITLYVDDAQLSITKAEIKAKNGSKYTYSVSKMDPNVTIPDQTFVFDKTKYPGVKIIN
jgi:outer membrane lipoprotein-sorting protein